ncbi:MAG: hypothetical protein ACTHU0_23360 [Kofleriaceae bacterium]
MRIELCVVLVFGAACSATGPSSNIDAECSTVGCGSDAGGDDADDAGVIDANDGSDAVGPDGSMAVDCSGVTITGVLRQTVAQVRTNAYLNNVDVTRYAGIWEAHNAQTGDSRSTKWGSPAGFAVGTYRGQYIALAFETTADQGQRGLLFRELDAALPSAHAYWSISRCPGDFPLTADACHSKGGAVASVGWEIGTTTTPSNCHLEPNTTYYFNIRFGTSADPAVPSCSQDECGHVYQQTLAN